jgi:single-strand DNA-binding protein
MSRGVNKVIIVGNTGQDPDVKSTQDGRQIVNLSIATTDVWKDKHSGERKEKTEWHRVIFFNRLAEIVAQYGKVGQKVYVEGQLRTRKWQDNNGQDRYTTEIVAREYQILDSVGQGQGGQQSHHQGQQQQRPQAPPIQQVGGFDDAFDDDIPF